jgi:SAM-dependent methyltransferase
MSSTYEQLLDTQRAFDGVASDYDGPAGNNEIIQTWRRVSWRTIVSTFPRGARLLDLGCGTGLDVAELASRGYRVVGIDWSPAMVERTRSRIRQLGLGDRARAENLGIHEIGRIAGEPFDGIYSNFGPLNCIDDLHAAGRACADLLAPGGKLVVSAIGRACPWEILYYAARFDRKNALRRATRASIAVSLGSHAVWTRYYLPRDFARQLDASFRPEQYRSLGLFVPPPYLLHIYQRLGPIRMALGALDGSLGSLPGFREVGDHFLMVLSRRARPGDLP